MQLTSEQIALITETQQIFEAVLQCRLPLEKLLEHCPLSADLAQEITAKFATVGHPDRRARSLRFAVEQLTALHNPLAGLGGALALGNHWRQRVRQTDIGYVRHHLGLSIAAEMFALKQLGQHEAILSHAVQNAALVADAGMPFTTALMAVYCANALLELGRLDEARDLLPSRETIHEKGRQEEAATGSPPRVNLAITLRDNAAMNANFMTEAGIGEIRDFETRYRIALDEIRVSVKSMLAHVGESEAEIIAFDQEIENLARRRTTGIADQLHCFADLMEMLRRRLGKYAPGLSFHDDDMEIIAIGLRADDKAAIVQALAASTRMMALQAARGDVSGWQSHAWTHTVLLEKSGRDSAALDLLEEIRRSRDDAVARASSARERAAIAGAFADLAPRLARLRALGGAPPSAVFEAIEWGKGQWLANGAPVPDFSEFKTALERAGVHYLTFLSGSSFTLGLSITASGEVVFREITIGRDQLEAAILSIRHDPAYRAAIIRNLPAQLGALMDWVPAEATAGTLIIAPHGPLFELPLHILPCASGLALAPACIVSRTHSAAALVRRLACETTRPESYYALHAPLRRNRVKADLTLKSGFHRRRRLILASVSSRLASWS